MEEQREKEMRFHLDQHTIDLIARLAVLLRKHDDRPGWPSAVPSR